ncbi:MAG: hypothetical protein KBT21_06505 [Treponema sp.]|nr:hypothetical protein [Candidatus Treponema merdequi]
MQKIIIKILIFFSLLIFLSVSCTTMADKNFTAVDTAIRNNDYATASASLESGKEYYYTKKENVLLYLDQGLLKHFSGNFKESNENFSLAEKEIERNFTKSISQTIATGIINDTVQDYPGETYEDLYTNIFMCLNYLHMKKFDDAFVEIKRFDNKMKLVGTEYESVLEVQKSKLEKNDFSSVDTEVKFHNSALARYLSLLLYRADGDSSNANVDYKKIQDAFLLQKEIYNFNIPECIKDDIEPPSNMARVNFITFTGFSPLKQEVEIRLPFRGAYYKQALPVMVKRESIISAVQIVMTDTKNQKQYKASLKKLEPIDNIVCDTYKQHLGSIYCRSMLRSIGKSVGSGALSTASALSRQSQMKFLFGALSMVSQVATEATERADVRICRYFPGTASIAGLTVPDGIYNIKINYYNKGHKILYSQLLENYHAKKGQLNLLESVCQK